jgi:small-conductance mechanosensitive channel
MKRLALMLGVFDLPFSTRYSGMTIYYWKLIETGVVIVLYVIIRSILFKLVNRNLLQKSIQPIRGMLIRRIIGVLLVILLIAILLLIWGVQQSDFLVFLGSLLTLLGVGFFAQWSILSNITASIIIFFNHPAKIGDEIAIMEGKDYLLEGTILNIGVFYTTIRAKTDGQEITLPNNVFMIKTVKKIEEPLSTSEPAM